MAEPNPRLARAFWLLAIFAFGFTLTAVVFAFVPLPGFSVSFQLYLAMIGTAAFTGLVAIAASVQNRRYSSENATNQQRHDDDDQ